jgi:large conductance mechanosensitive channel
MNNMMKENNPAAQFLDFLKKFGVIGLAIGTVVGGAVKEYVEAIVNSLVTPVVNYVLGLVKFNAGGKVDLPLLPGQTEAARQSLLIGGLIGATISFLVLMLLVYITVNVLISKFMTENDMKNAGV